MLGVITLGLLQPTDGEHGKLFYWCSLSADRSLGPLVTLLSLQRKASFLMAVTAAGEPSHQAQGVTLCPCLPGSPDSPLTPL